MLLSKSATTDQDVPVMIDLLAGARDPDGDHLTVLSASAPGHAVQLSPSGTITVTPAHGFVGTIIVSYTVSDGILHVSAAAQITVVSRIHTPMAVGNSLEVLENTPTTITLQGLDPVNHPLTFGIHSPPLFGALTGTAPNLVYTPAKDFVGNDVFDFVVTDGTATSPPASINLHVIRVNHPPTAMPQSVSTNEDTSIRITLTGSDPDGDSLRFLLQSLPSNGFLDTTGATWTYTPFSDFHGHDSFTFSTFDSELSSETVVVSIDVASVNDAPRVFDTLRNLSEDTPATFTLTGSDAEGDALTFSVDPPPQHGTLSGTPPTLTYTPEANFHGTDSFKFVASDGTDTSPVATFTLQVAAVNDRPVAVDGAVTTAEDTPVTIALQASDVDGDPLTYSIASPPSDGTLTGTGDSRTYKPAPNATGTRSFVFRASDASQSATATVTITITPVNDPPSVTDDWVATDQLTPLTIRVLANDSDPEGDAMSITSVGTPDHGTVNIVNDKLVYTPAAGFTGIEVFPYTVADPSSASATGTVHLGVGLFPPGAPTETLFAIAFSTADLSYAPSISSDGRYVAFATPTAILPGEVFGPDRVYVFDRGTRTAARMSDASDGTPADGASRNARISANGRYVVFESAATALVPGDTNARVDVFRHDRVTGETVRVSVAGDGSQANGASGSPQISDDGNVVAFASSAFNLVANDANGVSDIFVRDIAAGTTTRVSVSTSGGDIDLASSEPALSGNGRFVAFTSPGTNIVAGDTNSFADIFVRDRVAGTTARVSVSSTGVEANKQSSGASLSSDGRFISFLSTATNLLPGASGIQVYVRDTQSSTTTRPLASTSVSLARLSADGRHLVIRDGSVTLCDRLSGATAALPGSAFWAMPALSSNGGYVTVIDTLNSNLLVTPNPLPF